MSTLLSLAYQHHGFHGGLSGWIAHTLISAIIHGMIYELIWKTMRELTLGQSVVLVAVAFGRAVSLVEIARSPLALELGSFRTLSALMDT